MAYQPKNPNGQSTMANSEPIVIASDQSNVPVSLTSVPSHPVTNAGIFPVQATLDAGTNTVTATGTAGSAVTLTIPAAGAGLFTYITSLQIQIYATAARTGAATPILVTTTNITGSPVFTFETAQTIGTNTPIRGFTDLVTPLKTTTANTATTIVAPIATSGIWRITAVYYTKA
jgi:hypothetical protein